MPVLGAVFTAVLAVALIARRTWLPAVIGVAGGLPYTAAVVAGGNGVPLFSAAALASGIALLGTRPLRTTHWSANALAAFVAWATIATAVAPWMFAGVRVLVPRGGVDGQVLDPGYLTYSISNLAQLGYLLLAVCALLYLVRVGAAETALRIALVVGTVVTTVRGVLVQAGADVLAPLMDTLPGVAYAWALPGERLRGVFSEPSELAAFALPAAAYFAVTALRSSGGQRMIWAAASALSCANLLQAASGTAVVASAVVIAVGLLVVAVRYVVRGGRGTVWFVLGGLTIAIVLLAAGPQLAAPVEAIVDDKVGSQSYDSRTGADGFSWGVLADTLGIGAGLGANRPSSFGMTLLTCVGIPGTIAFAVFALGVLVRAARSPATVPASVALAAVLVAKLVGTPDLSTPILWLLLAACASSVWRPVAEPPEPGPDAAGARPVTLTGAHQ
ncbi:hypothetical protein QP157_01395 [Sphingomonas sp. LR61]|uniref:hypothetical protein n=1 Tax=Bacteria TaxID=2 RepID=UPI001356A321|nr:MULTISPECIES: hypothetical protein [unclassified Curtobacterium]MBF4587102.1 hypothetical protein [Curtobacterium sp. VKM Ac-2887]